MPANMMKAVVGSSTYVIGSSSATVIAGPMPGSTPTAVPSRTPNSANSRLSGVIASREAAGKLTQCFHGLRANPSPARGGSRRAAATLSALTKIIQMITEVIGRRSGAAG